MHPMYKVIKDIDVTHLALGNAVAFSVIAAKAKKCLLIVAPAGTGKSVVAKVLARSYPDAISLDSVTRSGLRDFKEVFTHYQGLVVVDDLGKIDTAYSRTATVTSFAELCYSHFISKHTMTVTVEIAEFFGSAILNVQPPVLSALVEADEWEVVTQDKTIRYYHLYRPTVPNITLPECSIDWGIDMSLVARPHHNYKMYSRLVDIASVQWSDARVLEHLDDLLRASAALARRQAVTNDDLVLLWRLMKPMTVERHVKTKSGFEVGRYLDTNLLAVLVEFASWKDISIARICRDYKISEATAYRLLSGIKEWFEPSKQMSKRLIPKAELRKVLREAGVER